MLNRRTVLAAALPLWLAASGCAGTRAARTDPAAPLRVAARPDVLEAGPFHHAAAALGPDRVVSIPGGVPNLLAGRDVSGALDQFEGAADLAGQSETQLLRLSVDHPDLRIIMTVTEGLYRIVARRSAGIAGLADLRGKRVGTFPRTSAAFFLHRMLASVGVADAEVGIVALRPSEMAAAFAEGRLDAIAIWEPESERVAIALGDDAVTFADPAIYRELYNLNSTAAALADPVRRAAIVAFTRALIDSSRVSRETPEAVWPLVVRHSGFDAALVAAAWPHHRFPAALPDDLLDLLVAEEEWLAAEEGRAPRSRARLDTLVDRTVLMEALAGR